MFVRDFGIVQLRREVLRRLQSLLHLLRVSVDAHGSKYQTLGGFQTAVSQDRVAVPAETAQTLHSKWLRKPFSRGLETPLLVATFGVWSSFVIIIRASSLCDCTE